MGKHNRAARQGGIILASATLLALSSPMTVSAATHSDVVTPARLFESVATNYTFAVYDKAKALQNIASVAPELDKFLEAREQTINNRKEILGMEFAAHKAKIQGLAVERHGNQLELKGYVHENYLRVDKNQPVKIVEEVKLKVELTSEGYRLLALESSDISDEYLRSQAVDGDYTAAIENERQNAMNERAERWKPKMAPAASSSGYLPLNRSAMKQYQWDWTYSFNPAYSNYAPYGGDCANFVSQVLRAGGASFDHRGRYQWYWYHDKNRTPSWSGVKQLRSYLLGNRREEGNLAGFKTEIRHLRTGDVVFIGDHHSVVVYDNVNGHVTVSAHTYAHRDRPLDEYRGAKTPVAVKWYTANANR